MIAEITLATGINPLDVEELLKVDARIVATLLDLVRIKAEKEKRAGKRGRR